MAEQGEKTNGYHGSSEAEVRRGVMDAVGKLGTGKGGVCVDSNPTAMARDVYMKAEVSGRWRAWQSWICFRGDGACRDGIPFIQT